MIIVTPEPEPFVSEAKDAAAEKEERNPGAPQDKDYVDTLLNLVAFRREGR